MISFVESADELEATALTGFFEGWQIKKTLRGRHDVRSLDAVIRRYEFQAG